MHKLKELTHFIRCISFDYIHGSLLIDNIMSALVQQTN